jgi:hypothetical protein
MNDYFPQVSENEGVYPMEINNTGAQDHSIDRLICAGPAHSPRPPHYRDERFIQGKNSKALVFCTFVLTYNSYRQFADIFKESRYRCMFYFTQKRLIL